MKVDKIYFQFILINHISLYLMKKGTPAATTSAPAKGAATQPPKGKAPPKPFVADDYVTLTLPREEVIEIRTAFEIFDQDGSGIIDPQELKQQFI